MLDRIAEFLSKNYNMLKAKDCRIHQTTIAETMGIKQFALSRIIAKLKKDGILIETRTYAVGRYSKSYGCGLVLARCFRDAKADMRHRDVYKPYTPGNANTEFLKDIQHFVAVGTPLDEVVRIILEKQSDRPKDKVRGAKAIERAFFLWQNGPEGVSSETA
jgi:DNA-binding Lrp family transcriptional regulator